MHPHCSSLTPLDIDDGDDVVVVLINTGSGDCNNGSNANDHKDNENDDDIYGDDDFHLLINLVCPHQRILGANRVTLGLHPFSFNIFVKIL